MKIVAIIQARVDSTRFPNKILKEINGNPIIKLILKRLSKSVQINDIVVASPDTNSNKDFIQYINNLGFKTYSGSEEDVLDRFYNAAKLYEADIIIRITGDCPLIDFEIVDSIVDLYLKNDYDYISNTIIPTYPDGLDTEVFSFSCLEKSWKYANTQDQREHVTPYIKESGLFSIYNYTSSTDYSKIRLTVDELSDIFIIDKIYKYYDYNKYINYTDIIKYYISNKKDFISNNNERDVGRRLKKGQKLWIRAKDIIPGGNMLLSKRSEMFLPDKWPSYYSKTKGCIIWDLDGKEFVDMSIMGIGTNILGYNNEKVDSEVIKTVKLGNMSTLNCPEEVKLAEKLIQLHPWAEMVRYARSGGEANAIAIRIARAATGRDKVAICGYHGWHDWYMAANLDNKTGLNNHLLPGLEANGIPKGLKNTTFTFKYNNIDELRCILNNNKISAIKMEVERSKPPEKNFLESVRKLADEHGAVLIFDECTSGFRETYGGLHLKYGVEPDIAMFGKALGNGYAITAVIGKRNVMDAAQKTFISSTFWTERIGPTAALKTLEVMNEINSWKIITEKGKLIQNIWLELSRRHNINLSIFGIKALSTFTINHENWLKFKTYITQEMLKEGILASNSVYLCTEHSDNHINKYAEILDKIFKDISDYIYENRDDKLLDGPICHSGFERLN